LDLGNRNGLDENCCLALICTHLDNRAAIWGTLLHFGVVGAAVLEDGLVVVDVRDENDNHGSAGVRSLVTFHTA